MHWPHGVTHCNPKVATRTAPRVLAPVSDPKRKVGTRGSHAMGVTQVDTLGVNTQPHVNVAS